MPKWNRQIPKDTCGVYFLTDRAQKHSYIGYSNDVEERYRAHFYKLKRSAKRTKAFQGHVLWAAILGFPGQTAYSFEACAKRNKRPKVYCDLKNQGTTTPPHPRLYKFFAPLLSDKFVDLCECLTIYVKVDNPNTNHWAKHLQQFYNVKKVVLLKSITFPPLKRKLK